MSENFNPTPEFTVAQAELVDTAWIFVRQLGSIRIQYPEGSSWQGAVTHVRAARTSAGEELIVRVHEISRPDLPYDAEQRSWDEHTCVELLNSAAREYTSAYAVRRATGKTFWAPDHTNEANDAFSQEMWRQTGGDSAVSSSHHDMDITDAQLSALIATIISPETHTDSKRTEAARDYFLQRYGQLPERTNDSDRLAGRSGIVRFIAELLHL